MGQNPSNRDPVEFEQQLHTDTRITHHEAPTGMSVVEVPALTILAHPDAQRVGELVRLARLGSGQSVALSRIEPTFAQPGSTSTSPLAEVHLSRRPLSLQPGETKGSIRLARNGSSTPATVDGKPLVESLEIGADAVERGCVIELGRYVTLLLHRQLPVHFEMPSYGLIGESTPVVRLRQQIRLAAGVEAPVLIRGASGTGKELVAKALHRSGRRGERPFVAVNMAAIPGSLAAAELFGASRGAFTGADRARDGFFRRAHGGTLFLDEIGETPEDVQPLLLRALESGEVQPVGGGGPLRVDVRVVAATDGNLEELIAAGRFRAPLLHRLASFEIHVPLLKDRRSDLGRLLYHFLARELAQLGGATESLPSSWPPASLVARLARDDWPGNVRQLRNVARRLAATHCATHHDAGTALAGDDLALAESLLALEPTKVPTPAPSDPAWEPPSREGSEESQGLDELFMELDAEIRREVEAVAAGRRALTPLGRWLEDDLILVALQQAEGVVSRGADKLGLAETTYRRRLERAQSAREERPTTPHSFASLLPRLIAAGPPAGSDLLTRVREAMLAAVEQTLPPRQAAAVLGVTVRTYRRWTQNASEPPTED